MVDGRFELRRKLGRGGMGTVWQARDLLLERDVALKEVRAPDAGPQSEAEAAETRDRVLQEARALARISHPNVVTVHHVVEERPYPWIVMELLPGRTLQSVLRAEGRVPPREAARYGLAVLAGLRAAHAAGVLHRDVKPANVLLRADGSAVLTDFGISLSAGSPHVTQDGRVAGSPEYMAPERVMGAPGAEAADLWSLGVLLFALVEGASPMRRATQLETIVAVVEEPVPEAEHAGPLGPVLRRLLVRDPARRVDAERLDALLESLTDAGDDTAPSVVRRPPPAPTGSGGTQDDRPPAPVALPGPPAPGVPSAPVAAYGWPPVGYGPQPAAPGGPGGSPGGFGPPTAPASSADAPHESGGAGRRGARRLLPIGLAAGAVAVVAAVVATLLVGGGDDELAAPPPVPPPATAPPSEEPSEEPAEDPADDPAEDLDEDPAEDPTEDPAGGPTTEPPPPDDPAQPGGQDEPEQDDPADEGPGDTWVAQLFSEPVSSGEAVRDQRLAAVRGDVPDAEFLRSDDFASLVPGYWVIYVPGPFADGRAAVRYCADRGRTTANECVGRFVSDVAADRELVCHPTGGGSGRCEN